MKKRIGLLLLVATLSIALAGCNRDGDEERTSQARPDENTYQAVLLTNQQLFFGKLHDASSNYPYLTDVYYLQQDTQKATVSDGKNPSTTPAVPAQTGPTFNVIKRGLTEIYGPTEGMHMSKDSIIYWENVGPKSVMAQGIEAKQKELAAKATTITPTTPVAPVDPVAPQAQ